jgi:hypothetical protein
MRSSPSLSSPADFGCVIIGGNGLHTPTEITDFVARLLRLGEVYHVTLDPSLDEIQRRVATRSGDHTPEWLADHVCEPRGRSVRARDFPSSDVSHPPNARRAPLTAGSQGGGGAVTLPLPRLVPSAITASVSEALSVVLSMRQVHSRYRARIHTKAEDG